MVDYATLRVVLLPNDMLTRFESPDGRMSLVDFELRFVALPALPALPLPTLRYVAWLVIE